MKSRFDTAKDILTPFNIVVKSVDKHDTLPSIKEDISVLRKLELPEYSYKEIIEKIIKEIKNRDQFKI